MPARPPLFFCPRNFSASPAASMLAACDIASGIRACSNSIGTISVSGRRYAAVIAERNTD